jgi:O-acetylserine/cysteine efflux transporter
MKNKDFLVLVLITAIWGFNFSFIKLGLVNFDPYLLAAIRFLLCAVPAIFVIKRPPVAWSLLAAYGFVFGVLQWGLIYAGIQLGVSAGVASLLTQCSVFMTMGLGLLFFKEKLNTSMVIGTLISFVGVFLIFDQTQGQRAAWGMLLILGGALAWAVSNVIVKKSGTTAMFGFFIWSSIFSPLPLLLLAYGVSGSQAIIHSLVHIDSRAILSVLFQVYPTSLLGYSVWNHFMQKYPVSQVAPLSLLVPVFGILGSVLIFQESLPTYKWIAMILILSGLIVQRYATQMVNGAIQVYTRMVPK